MSKNVLVVTSELKYSGPNNVIKSLVSGFGFSGIKLHVSSLRKRSCEQYTKDIEEKGAFVHQVGSKYTFFHILNLIKTLKPYAVNSHGVRADVFLYIISFIFDFKLVATIHNIPNEDYFYRYNKYVAHLMMFFHSAVFKSPRVLKVAVSKQVADNLLSLGASNVKVIYNGVDSDSFKPVSPNEKAGIIDKLALNHNRLKFVFCGHLTVLKDPLIVAQLANEFPNIDFIFLGDGPLKCDIEACGNNIYSFGRVSNVKDYLAVADYYIMPSRTEGMPMALIEAMLMDLPLICSDIPIFQELSKIQDINLSLFKVGDRDDLSLVISSVINQPRGNNRNVALQYFSSKHMSESYMRCFDE